jgi:hypothetical protein
MDIVNDRDEDGNVTKAAPSFDYIENKAIEEEHRKGQLGNQPQIRMRFLPSHLAISLETGKSYRLQMGKRAELR